MPNITDANTIFMLVAFLEANGRNNKEIASEMGISVSSVAKAKAHKLYPACVANMRDHLAEHAANRAVSLAEEFDEEAYSAFGTVKELHKHASMETVRLGAAKDILDRAPSAPRARKYEESAPKMIIQLGVSAVENMRQALSDGGAKVGLQRFDALLSDKLPLEPEKEAKNTEVRAISFDDLPEGPEDGMT